MESNGRHECSDANGRDPVSAPASRNRWAWWFGLSVVLLTFALLVDARLWRPDEWFDIDENVQVAEAQAWWAGRLDLPERKWDTALRDGRVYSYFPPMFSILAALVVPFSDGVPHGLIVALVCVVPVCAYVLFFRLTQSARWGAVWAIGLVCGTSLLPVLSKTIRGGSPYQVNHALSTIGLLLILIDFFGRRRIWPACLGLILTTLSRQPTFAFILPVVVMTWAVGTPTLRRRRIVMVACTCAAIALIYGGLNTLKFGSPLCTGYMLNHEGRDDVFAREARAHGLLSLHWAPRNFYYANIGLPDLHRVEIEGESRAYLRPNTMGTGIWWTTPLLLGLFLDGRKLLIDRRTAVWVAASAMVFAMLMFWHATGAVQRGFNRYSLDYIPALMAILAPRWVLGRRRWWTLAMVAWSLSYFAFLLPQPHLRVG